MKLDQSGMSIQILPDPNASHVARFLKKKIELRLFIQQTKHFVVHTSLGPCCHIMSNMYLVTIGQIRGRTGVPPVRQAVGEV